MVNLLKYRHELFTQNFQRCFYCQPANLCVRNNPIFEEIKKHVPHAELICGIPNISKLNLDLDSTPKIVLIDDLMIDFLNSPEMVNLLSVQVHHSNITVVFRLFCFEMRSLLRFQSAILA